MKVETLLENDRVLVATIDRVLFTHWYAAPQANDVMAYGAMSRRWHADVGAPTVGLSVADALVGLRMSPRTRQEASKNHRHHGEHMVALVAVVPDSDFMSALARSVLSGFALVSGSRVHHHVAREAAEGCRVAARELGTAGVALDAGALHRAVESLRSRAPARA